MLQAYIGIVSRRGLELLCPEHPQTIQFLQRRVQREQGQVAGIWSVLPEEGIRVVQATLALGHLQEALNALQTHARDCGLLPPSDTEDPSPHWPAIPLP